MNNNVTFFKNSQIGNLDILRPIRNSANALLAPIVINDNVLFQMDKIKFILSRVPDSNFVKIWLKMELERDKIIINATKNEGIDESLLKVVKEIKMFEIPEPDMFSDNPWTIIIQKFYKIKRNNLHYNDSCEGGLFAFRNAETKLNEILSKETKKNSLYTCCYIITFKNKYYYYIGSSLRIKDRLNKHTKNINNYTTGDRRNNTLNQVLKYFIDSEINYLKSKRTLDFTIKIVYLCTNYLNKFKKIYPDYELSKGEWILLYMISDFIIKTLEESLIIGYQPKLNVSNQVIYKYFEWEDEFLQIYIKNGKTKEYLKTKSKKYNVYEQSIKIIYDTESFISRLKMTLGLKPRIIKKTHQDVLIRTSTLYDLCTSCKLNQIEILNNLDRWHTYEGTNLKNPLKIIEIK